MAWADHYINELKAGNTVTFRPRGTSMSGRVESGEEVTVAPIEGPIKVDDIVLCQVQGRQYLHLVWATRGSRYLIGNNRGRVNGWVQADKIFGRLV